MYIYVIFVLHLFLTWQRRRFLERINALARCAAKTSIMRKIMMCIAMLAIRILLLVIVNLSIPNLLKQHHKSADPNIQISKVCTTSSWMDLCPIFCVCNVDILQIDAVVSSQSRAVLAETWRSSTRLSFHINNSLLITSTMNRTHVLDLTDPNIWN